MTKYLMIVTSISAAIVGAVHSLMGESVAGGVWLCVALLALIATPDA